MKEHHHFELLTIDHMLDIISVPYSSPIVINGKWRVPVMEKKLMMQDELLAIQLTLSSNKVVKNLVRQIGSTSAIPYSSTIVRRHVGVPAFQIKKDNFMILPQSK